MSLLESEKEPVMPADSLFRELLLTYRVLFGQDERSFRAFQRSCSRKDTKYASDPLLPVLCDRSWTMPDAHDLYRDINAGAVRDTYDSNADFPIMGPRLLVLQQFVKGCHPRTLTALLRDRRDPTAWYNVWTTQVCASILGFCIRRLTESKDPGAVCVPSDSYRRTTISLSNLASGTCKATTHAELSSIWRLVFKPFVSL